MRFDAGSAQLCSPGRLAHTRTVMPVADLSGVLTHLSSYCFSCRKTVTRQMISVMCGVHVAVSVFLRAWVNCNGLNKRKHKKPVFEF